MFVCCGVWIKWRKGPQAFSGGRGWLDRHGPPVAHGQRGGDRVVGQVDARDGVCFGSVGTRAVDDGARRSEADWDARPCWERVRVETHRREVMIAHVCVCFDGGLDTYQNMVAYICMRQLSTHILVS